MVISNVPGPPVPLYMAGAKMLTNYPTSIVVHGLALNITVQSYDQSLDFGLMADAQAMPEVAELAAAIRVAFEDLQALPQPGDPDHADTPKPQSLIGRAQRSITGVVGGAVKGAVGKVTKSVVDTAIDSARGTLVSQVRRRSARPATKKTAPRR
ncbi:MAG: DUF1298 domain-containing protein [Rubrivivax sp.]|nr:DUF1298 domain-containing protein [Rubrivivax sp.]